MIHGQHGEGAFFSIGQKLFQKIFFLLMSFGGFFYKFAQQNE